MDNKPLGKIYKANSYSPILDEQKINFMGCVEEDQTFVLLAIDIDCKFFQYKILTSNGILGWSDSIPLNCRE